MLESMFALEVNNADSPSPPTLPNNLYGRTFTMRVSDMRNVFQGMLHDGYDRNPRIFACLERIATLSDNTYVRLRYCG
jgi:hypothetical protein